MFESLITKYKLSREAYSLARREMFKGSTLSIQVALGSILTVLITFLISYSVIGVMFAGFFFEVIPYILVMGVVGAFFWGALNNR